MTLDESGLSLEQGSGTTNAIKFMDGAELNAAIYNLSDASTNQTYLQTYGLAGKISNTFISAYKGTGVGSSVRLSAYGSGTIIGSVVLTDTSITINENGSDIDTNIKGDTTTVLTVDAGLEAVGIGGAAESGSALKVTGQAHVTGTTYLDGAVVINDNSTATNFRVESDGNANMLFVDGTNNRVGVGTGSPATELDVTGAITGYNIWQNKRKTTNESRQSNTTLTVDGVLTATLMASQKYAFRGRVWFDTPAAADFKYSISFAGTTLYCKHSYFPAGSSTETVAIATATPASATVLGTGTTGGYVEFEGIAIVDGSNRTLNFNWAQNTSTASNTTVLAGSYLEYLLMV